MVLMKMGNNHSNQHKNVNIDQSQLYQDQQLSAVTNAGQHKPFALNYHRFSKVKTEPIQAVHPKHLNQSDPPEYAIRMQHVHPFPYIRCPIGTVLSNCEIVYYDKSKNKDDSKTAKFTPLEIEEEPYVYYQFQGIKIDLTGLITIRISFDLTIDGIQSQEYFCLLLEVTGENLHIASLTDPKTSSSDEENTRQHKKQSAETGTRVVAPQPISSGAAPMHTPTALAPIYLPMNILTALDIQDTPVQDVIDSRQSSVSRMKPTSQSVGVSIPVKIKGKNFVRRPSRTVLFYDESGRNEPAIIEKWKPNKLHISTPIWDTPCMVSVVVWYGIHSLPEPQTYTYLSNDEHRKIHSQRSKLLGFGGSESFGKHVNTNNANDQRQNSNDPPNNFSNNRNNLTTPNNQTIRACMIPLYDASLGSDVNTTDVFGYTALHEVAYLGLLDCVKDLIARDAAVDVMDRSGRTPLFWAALSGHVDVVQHLLDSGADVDLTEDNGVTPLHVALLNDHWDVAKMLVKGGADLTLKAHGLFTAKECSSDSDEFKRRFPQQKDGVLIKRREDDRPVVASPILSALTSYMYWAESAIWFITLNLLLLIVLRAIRDSYMLEDSFAVTEIASGILAFSLLAILPKMHHFQAFAGETMNMTWILDCSRSLHKLFGWIMCIGLLLHALEPLYNCYCKLDARCIIYGTLTFVVCFWMVYSGRNYRSKKKLHLLCVVGYLGLMIIYSSLPSGKSHFLWSAFIAAVLAVLEIIPFRHVEVDQRTLFEDKRHNIKIISLPVNLKFQQGHIAKIVAPALSPASLLDWETVAMSQTPTGNTELIIEVNCSTTKQLYDKLCIYSRAPIPLYVRTFPSPLQRAFQEEEKIILVAAGMGIAPMFAIIDHLYASNCDQLLKVVWITQSARLIQHFWPRLQKVQSKLSIYCNEYIEEFKCTHMDNYDFCKLLEDTVPNNTQTNVFACGDDQANKKMEGEIMDYQRSHLHQRVNFYVEHNIIPKTILEWKPIMFRDLKVHDSQYLQLQRVFFSTTWKQLGEKLLLDPQILDEIEEKKDRCIPVKEMLQIWKMQQGATINHLRTIFNEINNIGAVELLNEWEQQHGNT